MPAMDPVWDSARTQEPDRYLAALYAPEPARSRLMALAAFQGEITRIPATVREPLLAEIRLQWWRDALDRLRQGELTGHPGADRLGRDLVSGLLPLGLLSGMIDEAGNRDTALLLADAQVLRSHLNKSHGAAFALAARALGARHSDLVETATVRAGFVYGLARLLAEDRVRDAEQRDSLTTQCHRALPEAAAAVARLDSALLPGFLPLAMASVYLHQAGPGVSPLKRWWRLWRAQMRGRVA